MNIALLAGLALTVAGLAGYLVGITAPYPGRAFSVSGVMVGITLLAIGTAGQEIAEETTASAEPGDEP
ncbi:hypothetical protein [Halorussus amylolyticus]|uniref:hypothetical protein n=1 Tax=Halorussus amylolyticus TaxID=1126242 RepID=UPI00104E55C8|nr:hypothetical protein [Halorussus amylolyticus]